MTRRWVLGAVAVACVLAGQPTAHAAPRNTVTVDVGISQVKIGDSLKQVRAKVGSRGKAGPVETMANGRPFTVYRFPKRLHVQIVSGFGVNAMWTDGPRQRTRSGIRVGSTQGELVDAVDVSCQALLPDGSRELCQTEELPTEGETSTAFYVEDDTITRIEIATLLD